MAHDATKVQMGSSRSSVKDVDNRAGSIAAGLAVRLKSDGTISLLAADGNLLGISMGGPLTANLARTAIARTALQLPVHLTDAFTPVVGAQVNLSDTTGRAIAAGAGATAVNAVYVSGILTGITEAGASINVALIDFPGGL